MLRVEPKDTGSSSTNELLRFKTCLEIQENKDMYIKIQIYYMSTSTIKPGN